MQATSLSTTDMEYFAPSLLEHEYLSVDENSNVGTLPIQDYRVDEQTITNEVDKVLRDAHALPGVIVQCDQKVAGVISRRDFYEILGRRYGVAIFLNRPIQMMLEMIEPETMVVPYTESIPDTVALALGRPREKIYEPILVAFSADDHRLLDIYTLLLAQTQIFSNLQRRLQMVNDELEQRVADRTAELLAVNENLELEVQERRWAEQRLEIRLSYEQALTQSANTLLIGGDTHGVTLETLTYLQKAVGTSRVFMANNFEQDDLGPSLRLRRQVCAPGVDPIPQHLEVLPHAALGGWLNRLWSAEWIIGQLDETDGDERRLLQELGFVSILLLPIGEPGNWSGLIGFGETENRRDWDEADIQLLQTVAQMLYAYLERLRNAEILAEARDEALRASQFKSELLAKVSHELRTPLGAILGYAQLLSFGSYGPINDEQKDTTELIIRSTKYLNSLVNGLLDQAQIESGKIQLQYEIIDIRELVDEIETRMQILAQNKALAFLVEIDPDIPAAFNGDRMRIEQVLINLLGNAIKFTEAGMVKLKVSVDRQNLCLQVIDTGSGIPKNEQRRIFDAFTQVDGSTTRRFTGTGLGLSISQQLVEMMGGQITVYSELNCGTTFTVNLPFDRAPKETPKKKKRKKKKSKEAGRPRRQPTQQSEKSI